ncbi:MAG TPA: hypothetical protein VM577_10290 [Anaerovoracaceae bacterium]|nr:hypothetical protein [Anaerovoracaceae bacterium]
MILIKKLTRREVLETLAMVAADTLPKEILQRGKGVIDVTYDSEDGVEIVFREPELEN